jgi:ribose transport system substrate-binding protein
LATFPTQVAELTASKTPYISTGTTDQVGNGVTANIGNTADYVRRGLWMANWVVADSNGTANTVVFNLSTYPVLDNLTTSFQQTVSSLCSQCKVDVQDVQTASVGTTLPAQIVSYLQSHPSVNYVMMTYGDMSIGVPSALAAAGLSSKVKLVTQSGSLQQVADGQQAVNTPEPDQMIGWMMMDAAVRALSGQPVNESQYAVLPGNYITKANVGNPSVPYGAVPNFAAQFLKLWHVG